MLQRFRPAAFLAATALVVALAPINPAQAGPSGKDLATKAGDCFGCHAVMKSEGKRMGPSFEEVATKYAGDKKAPAMLAGVIKKGGSGHWGSLPMPPHPAMSDADAKAISTWILSLKPAGKPKKK